MGAEDDVEEEDVLVPTLHVGARSPYTVRDGMGWDVRRGGGERGVVRCACVARVHPLRHGPLVRTNKYTHTHTHLPFV
jgi:hypothetical protein